MSEKFPRLMAELERGFERQLHRGVQLFASIHGSVVADLAIGESRPDQTMSLDTISLWLSSGKPITSVALAILHERGHIDWDDPVEFHLPEFVDKQAITIRHLLNHTSGLPKVDTGWPNREWAQINDDVCRTSPGFPAGEQAEYQPAATWFLLGEIVSRISGRKFSDFVREFICEPLGMYDSWNGMPANVWSTYANRIGMMWARKRAQLTMLSSHEEAMCVAPSPGGNYRGPIRELGWFYEMLLGNGVRSGTQILKPETVQTLTARSRDGMIDHSFQHHVDFGLGFIVDSNRYGAETVPYGFGRHASELAYGHGGAESSCAFADPKHGLVVAWIANVRVGEGRHQNRNRAINSAIYEDIGLAGRA